MSMSYSIRAFKRSVRGKRPIWIRRMSAPTGKEKKMLKREGKKKNKKKHYGNFRQRGSDISASARLLMWRLLLLRKWWFDVSVRGSGVRKDEMTVLACPSYHPTARASDPSLSCKEKEVLCSVRERECCGAAGWGWKRRRKRRRGGDDRVTAWLIIFVAHLSPNNTQTLDRRGRGAEKDGETQKDIKTKSETGEGGDRSTARQQGLKGGVWVRRKKKKKPEMKMTKASVKEEEQHQTAFSMQTTLKASFFVVFLRTCACCAPQRVCLRWAGRRERGGRYFWVSNPKTHHHRVLSDSKFSHRFLYSTNPVYSSLF